MRKRLESLLRHSRSKKKPLEPSRRKQTCLRRFRCRQPVNEQKRKQLWMSLPRRAKIAIRKLHRNFRHLPKQALAQMLRASKAPKCFIDAAKAHRCDVCAATELYLDQCLDAAFA